MTQESIDDILYRAYESEDAGEIAALVERALALSPDNPEALMLKADLVEDDEERLPYLERALEETRRYIQEEGLSAEDILEDDIGLAHLGLLQRAAYTLFFLEDDGRALELTEELLACDPEDHAMAKTLYYRILLEREEWARVLGETMKDTARGLGWAYARMISAFMLSGGKKGKKPDGGKMNGMLWDAVRMAPNVPFYILGYIPDPVDDSEDEDFHFGLMYENVWPASSQDVLNWFSKAVILFGLLTGRFGEESDDMREILDALGGSSDYEELTERLKNAPDDKSVLDALASGGYPTSI